MNTKCCLSLSYYRKLASYFREDGYISTANDITDLVNEIEYLQEELIKAKGETK